MQEERSLISEHVHDLIYYAARIVHFALAPHRCKPGVLSFDESLATVDRAVIICRANSLSSIEASSQTCQRHSGYVHGSVLAFPLCRIHHLQPRAEPEAKTEINFAHAKQNRNGRLGVAKLGG